MAKVWAAQVRRDVMDDQTCMVDMAKYFMDFIQRESCGKCIPCREGTRRMLEILQRITRSPKSEAGNDALHRFQGVIYMNRLAEVIRDTSLCGLGLSIVKRISELYNWEVTVKSQTDVGTTFTVRLRDVPVGEAVSNQLSAVS